MGCIRVVVVVAVAVAWYQCTHRYEAHDLRREDMLAAIVSVNQVHAYVCLYVCICVCIYVSTYVSIYVSMPTRDGGCQWLLNSLEANHSIQVLGYNWDITTTFAIRDVWSHTYSPVTIPFPIWLQVIANYSALSESWSPVRITNVSILGEDEDRGSLGIYCNC